MVMVAKIIPGMFKIIVIALLKFIVVITIIMIIIHMIIMVRDRDLITLMIINNMMMTVSINTPCS